MITTKEDLKGANILVPHWRSVCRKLLLPAHWNQTSKNRREIQDSKFFVEIILWTVSISTSPGEREAKYTLENHHPFSLY